jgi:hypothetical protein
VLSVSTLGTAAETVDWFKKGHESSSVGTYEIRGTRLKFSTATAGYGAVDYDGTIDGETLVLQWHSHINGADGTDSYRFEKVAVQ